MKNQMFRYAELRGSVMRYRLRQPIWLMRVRTDNELELICEWTIVRLPVTTPDIAVIDFNQAFNGHLVQVCVQSIGMSNNDRLSGREQFVNRTIVRLLIPAVKNEIVDMVMGRFIDPGVSVHLDADFQSALTNLFFVNFKTPVHQTFKMVADADDDRMLNSSDESDGLLGYDRVVTCREGGVNM